MFAIGSHYAHVERVVQVASERPGAPLPPGRWVGLEQALQMGLPAPLRKLLSR